MVDCFVCLGCPYFLLACLGIRLVAGLAEAVELPHLPSVGSGIVGVGIGVVLVIHDWHLLYLCNGSMSRKNTPYSQKISKKLVDIAELV